MHGAGILIMLALAGAAATTTPAPQPGKWTHQTKLISASIPGVPDAVVRAAPVPKPRTSCLTAQQSTRTPQQLLYAPAAVCTARAYTMAKGKISGRSTCRVRQWPTPVKTVTTGTYTATRYSIRSVTMGMRGGQPMTVISNGSGQWLAAGCG